MATQEITYLGPDANAYDHLAEEDFHGAYCACGRRMHASDVECERCYHEREFPDAE